MNASFLAALGATVVALVVVLLTGRAARRKEHYASVVAFFGLLVWAIREAEIEGRGLVYEGLSATIKQIHFGAVTLTFLAVPVLLVTGVRLMREESPEHRRAHQRVAAIFVGLVLLTCALGTAMTMTATRIDA